MVYQIPHGVEKKAVRDFSYEFQEALMANIIEISDLTLPELAPYARLT